MRYNGPSVHPDAEGVYPIHPMQAAAFSIVMNSKEPSAKGLNTFFELRNQSDVPQRVLLFPDTGIDKGRVCTSTHWEEALGRKEHDVVREMDGYLEAGNTRSADSLWNVLKAYNTRATITLAPGETYTRYSSK